MVYPSFVHRRHTWTPSASGSAPIALTACPPTSLTPPLKVLTKSVGLPIMYLSMGESIASEGKPENATTAEETSKQETKYACERIEMGYGSFETRLDTCALDDSRTSAGTWSRPRRSQHLAPTGASLVGKRQSAAPFNTNNCRVYRPKLKYCSTL